MSEQHPSIETERGATLLALAVTCLALGPQASGEYEFVFFEVAGAPITGGRGLNDTGCQVGYYQTDPEDFMTAHAIRRCGGVIETVDPPTSVGDRRAFGINDSGTLVGSALRALGADGFELSAGTYTWVEYPGADQTVIRGINNAGDVVGEYANSDEVRHAFARLDGTFINVDVPGAISSKARGINDLGEIVGHYDDSSGARHGFHRSAAGVYTTIDVLGADQTLAGGINDDGDIAGTFFDLAGNPTGFVITTDGTIPLDIPGAVSSFVTDTNEAGQIIGESVDASGTHRGFVATPTLFADGFESGELTDWSGSQR